MTPHRETSQAEDIDSHMVGVRVHATTCGPL